MRVYRVKLWFIELISKNNEMNRALGHFCSHTGLIGPGEPPEDGEMCVVTPPPESGVRFPVSAV